MFASDSASRSKPARPRWNRTKTRAHHSERLVTRAARPVAESLERRMLLSAVNLVKDINLSTTYADSALRFSSLIDRCAMLQLRPPLTMQNRRQPMRFMFHPFVSHTSINGKKCA